MVKKLLKHGARLFFFAALLLSAACRPDAGRQPAVPIPTAPTADDVVADNAADVVATAVAATLAAQPSPAPPTPTPTPARHPLVGRWRYEHAEEGLRFTDVIEFFADGLYTARLEGSISYCKQFNGLPGCESMPDLPIDRGESGTYEFLSATQARLRDTTGQLDPFTIIDLSPTRLVIVMNDKQRAYERVQP